MDGGWGNAMFPSYIDDSSDSVQEGVASGVVFALVRLNSSLASTTPAAGEGLGHSGGSVDGGRVGGASMRLSPKSVQKRRARRGLMGGWRSMQDSLASIAWDGKLPRNVSAQAGRMVHRRTRRKKERDA